jgi:hypothetical protein
MVRMTMLSFVSDYCGTHLNVEFCGDWFVVAEQVRGMVSVRQLVNFERDVFVVVWVYPVQDSVAPGWSSPNKKFFLRYIFPFEYKLCAQKNI